MFFFHFLIMLRRWFNDQDFIVVFNFFSVLEKSWKYGIDLFACFVDLEKVAYNMTAFLSLEGSEEEWR